ncbi:hypothetical protein [Actinoplanes sp. GCM10030250]|uniref:hypothetical protein n=1 Tax=Actinoplanes sp. GCM10030250 TaxID=3273376 RepID=UPI00360CCC8A
MRIVKLAAGLAVGYVLGSRAGREKYEQIAATARKVSAHPSVVQAQEKAKTLISPSGSSGSSSTGSTGSSSSIGTGSTSSIGSTSTSSTTAVDTPVVDATPTPAAVGAARRKRVTSPTTPDVPGETLP